MNIIWATRGKAWGFRFLRADDCADPLQVYEVAFAGTGSNPEVFQKNAGNTAVRFPDPDGRRDRSGRVIPHEFVVSAPESCGLETLEDARSALWREVKDRYAAVWDQPSGPIIANDAPG